MTSNPNENLHPVLEAHIRLVYKYFANEKFRTDVLSSFDKLGNEIYRKNDQRASVHRKLGNEFYQKQQYQDALIEYNQAVSMATWNTSSNDQDSEISLALANRSAALLKLEKYTQCLHDVNQALLLTPTEKLTKKLLLRKKECEKNGQTQSNSDGHKPIEKKRQETNLVWSDDGTAKASVKIRPGHLVIYEKSEFCVLKSSSFFSKCYNCFASLSEDLTMPCKGCTQVKFCSSACFDEAWFGGHSLYCLYINLFNCLKGKEQFRYPPILACFQLKNFDFQHLFNLLRIGKLPDNLINFTCPDEDDIKTGRIAESAAHLLTYFTIIKPIIPQPGSHEKKYDIELVGGLLFMLLRSFQSQVREITCLDLIKPLSDIEPSYLEEKIIGYGIFSQVSKQSRSCDPNTSVFGFEKRSIIVRAIRDIEENEKITLDLGVNWKICTRDQRKAFLISHYDYDCKCSACENKLQPESEALICPTCKGPLIMDLKEAECLECGEKNINREEIEAELLACQQIVRQANLLLIRKEPDIVKAEDLLLDVHKRFKKILHSYNSAFIEVCDRLSFCYKKLRKFRLSLVYMKKVKDCVDKKYPLFHHAMINTLVKLVDREAQFLTQCKRRSHEEENKNLYIETLSSLPLNLKLVKKLVEMLEIERDFYDNFFNSINQQLYTSQIKV